VIKLPKCGRASDLDALFVRSFAAFSDWLDGRSRFTSPLIKRE
jgi:hypothetical protein